MLKGWLESQHTRPMPISDNQPLVKTELASLLSFNGAASAAVKSTLI
jgi:hypothetical protein